MTHLNRLNFLKGIFAGSLLLLALLLSPGVASAARPLPREDLYIHWETHPHHGRIVRHQLHRKGLKITVDRNLIAEPMILRVADALSVLRTNEASSPQPHCGPEGYYVQKTVDQGKKRIFFDCLNSPSFARSKKAWEKLLSL